MAVSLVDPHGRWAYPAGSTSLQQFMFVALNASGQLIAPSANGLAIGVLDEGGNTLTSGTLNSNGEYTGGFVVGANYGIVFRGVVKVYAAVNLAPMTAVATDANGHAVAATGAGTYILGYTMEACNSGDLVPVNVGSPALHN